MAEAAVTVSDYDSCVTLVEQAPEDAEQAAASWAGAGGGAAAAHCRALALAELGAPVRAAEVLTALAAEAPDLPDATRGTILLQAGELLLGAGRLEAAAAQAREAAAFVPGPEAHELSARIRAERGDWAGTVADLDRAIAETPNGAAPNPALLVLRASAQRRLNRLLAARDDAEQARTLAPGDPAVWLELGSIRAALGQRDGARRAFAEVLRLAPDDPIADAARARIQALEAGG